MWIDLRWVLTLRLKQLELSDIEYYKNIQVREFYFVINYIGRISNMRKESP